MARGKHTIWILPVFCLFAACSSDSQPALRVGGSIWPGYEPMYLARDQGDYDSKQIQLIDFPSAAEEIRAYRNGVIDIGMLSADVALTIAAIEPGKHKIILIADFSNGADCILAQPPFTHVAKLKGRRIGVDANGVGGYVLMRALQLNGLSIDDIQVVALSVNQQVAAFEAGTIDAVVTFEPHCATLLSSGVQEVFTSKEIPGEVIDVAMTRTDLIATRRAALQHFVSGWFKGLRYLKQSPQEAAKRAAVHERIAPESFLASLQGLELLDRDHNLQLLGNGPENIDKGLAMLAHTMRDSGLLMTTVDVSGLRDNTIVARAAP